MFLADKYLCSWFLWFICCTKIFVTKKFPNYSKFVRTGSLHHFVQEIFMEMPYSLFLLLKFVICQQSLVSSRCWKTVQTVTKSLQIETLLHVTSSKTTKKSFLHWKFAKRQILWRRCNSPTVFFPCIDNVPVFDALVVMESGCGWNWYVTLASFPPFPCVLFVQMRHRFAEVSPKKVDRSESGSLNDIYRHLQEKLGLR